MHRLRENAFRVLPSWKPSPSTGQGRAARASLHRGAGSEEHADSVSCHISGVPHWSTFLLPLHPRAGLARALSPLALPAVGTSVCSFGVRRLQNCLLDQKLSSHSGLAAPEAPRSPASRGGSVCAEASPRVFPGWAVMLSLRVGISSVGSCCWAPRAVGQGAWLRHPKQREKTGHMGKKVMGEFMKRGGIQGPCSWNENQGVYDGHRLPGGACVWPGGRAPHRSLPSHVCLR